MENSKKKKGIGERLSLILCYAIFLGMTSFTLSSCSTHRAIRLRNKSIREWSAYQWEEIKKNSNHEVNEWTVYSRKVKGTNCLAYKVEGDIKSFPKACVSSFKQDIHNQADGSESKKYPTYQILEESEESLLTYAIHKETFPFKNTEMSFRYLFFQDSTTEEVKWKEAWDEGSVPPPSEKLSRVQTFSGSWHFSPISNGHSKAVYSVQFDAKKMPHWLVNKMVIKFLVEGFENIREMASK